jgi:hypothetical protein
MSLYCRHIGDRYTIQGQCAECWPEGHHADSVLASYYKRQAEAFFHATGKRDLGSWFEFEQFLDENARISRIEIEAFKVLENRKNRITVANQSPTIDKLA